MSRTRKSAPVINQLQQASSTLLALICQLGLDASNGTKQKNID
jgi:hypothetical protein